ncbi:ABC transporter ATP-binding protein/permease [Acetatifactor muris]|uniref:Multidrug export ATP-binding/permease protein n=1 Tax=Acetatifactor muris TaxID=879566 RepID=A0A2K4ZC80_9FIRM|nr:ABC transporter ATP-binding protein [Acetatifactor muris]MCI8799351.1 ABC transporter ATP-binding protein [Lachnospiraceae bacterium]MCR2046391.1 ABC transporter ATP-binding protein/permease [Acetatifactor muris]SOY28040.1 Putative multidrug export ATP-binding/permease protein [Acetatifactor muris]
MFKRFICYYKPHRKMLALDMLASLLISVIGMVYPVVTNKMLNIYIPEKMYSTIVMAGVIVLALYIVRMLLRYFVQYYGHLIGVQMQSQMRQDLFAHLERQPFSFYDNHETGRIMTRITSDLFEVCELAHHGPENLLISSVMILLSFAYLFLIDPILTLIIFTCVPILVVVTLYFRRAMSRAFDDRRKSNATINAAVESSVTGIRVTKAYTNSAREVEKFREGDRQFVDASRRAYHAMAQFHSSTSFVTDIFNVFILIAGGLFLYAGRISFGDYSTFIVSVNLFINPVNTLIGFMEQFQNGVSGFRRFVEIMEEAPEQDAPDAKELTNVQGVIEFKNVTYAYDTSKEVLHDINLRLEKGRKLALVGPSGGGKTTLCHLLPNFYKLEEGDGSILIDGQDIRSLTMESVRRNIGIVQQDVFLFVGTIRENILYGRPDATQAEVYDAARRANIHDYIMTLEKGYDTEIGERGVKLSGGQKQRLSIARVFLKNPAILILDEATSALDNTTEVLIQQALDELCRGRTTLVVAHRLSTIRNADEIAVVMNGRITERGTHEELMTSGGTYQKLYSLQFRENDFFA